MDGIQLTGRLRLTLIPQEVLNLRSHARPFAAETMEHMIRLGCAEVLVDQPNMVVDLGLSAISRLVGYGLSTPDVTNGSETYAVADVTDLRVTTMSFGNLAAPTAPTAADYELEDSTALTSVTPTVSYPGNAQVRWSGVIPSGVFTGDQITEEALILANGALFARTTFAPQAITAGFGVQADHDFTFTRA